jgi:hypothetical protein
VFALASIIVAGCSHGPARVTAPKISASSVAAKAIEQYDADHDGKLSGAELDACPSIKSALDKIDTTSDGTVTAEKLTARIQAWQKGVARIGFGCTVLHNGEPLAGADVKFVPEKFMGGSYPTGTGKTSGLGKTDVTMPATEGGDNRPGMPPGFYRVEITKTGDNIPAKYNTETTLGQEIAVDNTIARSADGVVFDLKY